MSKGALAHQIEILQDQLAAALEGNASAVRNGPDQSNVTGRQLHLPDAPNDHLQGVIRFLTLGHDTNGEQTYLGPSSGVSIVENVSRMVYDAAGAKLLPIATSTQQPEASLGSSDETIAAPPDDMTGSKILDAYFNNMHVRLPFLDRCDILELHANRHRASGNNPEEQYGQFKLFMVYAIGAVTLQVTETYDSTPPNTFLVTALRFDPTLRESISIASIEAMLLLVLYNLRTTSNSSVWYMIGLAMRTCIDFGLHREARYRRLRPHEAQLRRRLFWSVYITERYTAWSLGRPFSIPEEEIDAEPPFNIDDSINSDEVIEQIEFKTTLSSLALADGDFVLMHWNNAIRMLLQPFLSTLHPQDELIGTCLYASGQMCQFFKKLRQRDSSGHSFLLVNSVFMAGLTMCFCLFRCPNLWTPAISNDIRACSSTLCVMAERNPRLKNYRDGLETVINRAMEYVEDAYQTSRNNSGICSQLAIPNDQLHPTSTSDSTTSAKTHMQSLQSNAPQDLGTEVYDWQNTDIFSDLPGLPPNLQSLFTGDHADVLDSSFYGVLTQDLWASDAFDLPFLEDYDRRT
ncbi:hypothetical protein N7494_004440 [Penicillium frequentans]|uniref:Xylanolytic transcriptional activator regulatory domain-containing protein n=1 Tax=Penicillium frequentans TaxID=3151616 RepID=A0AAD6GGJ7_9EURO|nr:hypothetical protein N7494_004440 [Penicillium glabrum]